MLPYLGKHFGNPSSSHSYGNTAKLAVDRARTQAAELLGCAPGEIIFTSGGTESNNLAIIGSARANQHRGKHIITSAIEHPAVLNVCDFLERSGFTITRLPVDQKGRVAPDDLENTIQNDTILVSIMHANNEVGTVQAIREMAHIAHSHNIVFHTDAAQSVGKIPVKIANLCVDLLSIAGHKIYAPKGIGILYKRSDVDLEKVLFGAGHEFGLRPGTENVASIAAIGEACNLITENLAEYVGNMRECRDFIETEIKAQLPDIIFNGDVLDRLPNTSSISVRGILATDLIGQLESVSVSAGAACHADVVEASHVLQAMGVPENYVYGTLRISTGRFININMAKQAVKELAAAIMQTIK